MKKLVARLVLAGCSLLLTLGLAELMLRALPLPDLPDLGLGRAPALQGNVSMNKMMDTWNPILVALLMPGVAE